MSDFLRCQEASGSLPRGFLRFWLVVVGQELAIQWNSQIDVLVRSGAAGVANKVVKHFVLDQELIDALMRKSAARKESMSLIVREALRAHFTENRAEIGAAK
jgi:hypothetical protein